MEAECERRWHVRTPESACTKAVVEVAEWGAAQGVERRGGGAGGRKRRPADLLEDASEHRTEVLLVHTAAQHCELRRHSTRTRSVP